LTLLLWQSQSLVRPIEAQDIELDNPITLPLSSEPVWTSERADWVNDLAWGDVDNDGDLDLIVGTSSSDADNPQPNRLYLNDNGQFGASADWLSQPSITNSVVWSDINRDGWLDLVVGNNGKDEIYLNEQGMLATTPFWRSGSKAPTSRLAVGDVDGDGWYDLVAAHLATNEDAGTDVVYIHTGRNTSPIYLEEGVPLAGSEGNTLDLTLADADGNHLLDLVTISPDEIRLYRSDGNTGLNHVVTCPVSFGLKHAQWGPIGDVAAQQLALGGSDPLQRGFYANVAPFSFSELANCNLDIESRRLLHYPSYSSFPMTWADVDGDGVLDIATAVRVFLQNDSAEFVQAKLPFPVTNSAIASWADVDGDGDLDVMVAEQHQPLRLFYNEQNQWRPVPELVYASSNDNVLWGDIDNDGDLDRVRAPEAASGSLSRGVILDTNENGEFVSTRPFSGLLDVAADTALVVRTFAWGDVNDDMFIDIVIGTYGSAVQLYQNDGQGSFLPEPIWSSANDVLAADLAWGDVDADGHLDLAIGTNNAFNIDKDGGRDVVYRFNSATGLPEELPWWQASDIFPTAAVRWSDVDQDGDLDLVARDTGSPLERIYLNDNGHLAATALTARSSFIQPHAPVNLNGDAELFRPTTNGVEQFTHYPANPDFTGASPLRVTLVDRNVVTTPLIGVENIYSAHSDPPASNTYYDNGLVTFFYEFTGAEERAYDAIGFYSIDGGVNWQSATPTADTVWQQLQPDRHVFNWDVVADGLTGRNDDVRFRLQVQPRSPLEPQPNSVPGIFQQPFAQAETLPFRVQGTRLRIVQGDEPVEGAVIYHRSADTFGEATLLRDHFGMPLSTNDQGYLSGRPILLPEDQIFAVWPVPTATVSIPFTDQYNFYYTSGAPDESGVAFESIIGGEVQTVTVSAENPLLLFDLVVSLEWDARNDTLFLLELEESIKAASALLYDITDGQIALGNVHVVHNKAYWGSADIVIYADNSLRPSAAIGGIVNRPISDTLRTGEIIDPAYGPGQIHMGTVWDPFGERTADLGVDWSNTLAHELAHYLLFLPDNYLGFKGKSDNVLGLVDCPGSFMTTSSDPDYSELLVEFPDSADETTNSPCERTVAAVTMGRTDWETIQRFYRTVTTPSEALLNIPAVPLEGPANLLLEVTDAIFWAMSDENVDTLPARNFTVRGADQERLRLPNAQAYLFRHHDPDDQTDDVLLPLGSPTGGGDRLKVRGVTTGDHLCLFDTSLATRYAGCVTLDGNSASISVTQYSDPWQPAVVARAITSRTVAISVTHESDVPLHVQLFPSHYRSLPGIAPTATLQVNENGVHTAVLTMSQPAFDVALHVWEPGNDGHHLVTAFRLDPPWNPTAAADTESVRRDLLEIAPIGNPQGFIVGGPQGFIVGGPQGFIVGGPQGFIVGGPQGFIVGGPQGFIVGGPQGFIVGGPDDFIAGNAAKSFAAPTLSADAQVVVYSTPNYFDDTGVSSLQAVATIPELASHPWLVPVGQAYNVVVSETIESLDEQYIAFHYLQREVPAGHEDRLALYYLPDSSTEWQLVEAGEQFVENLIVAPLQESGTYAIMASVTMPPLEKGWNLVSYPLAVTRTVTNGLASIEGQYDGFVTAEGTTSPPATPEISTTSLTFGRVYWLHITVDDPKPLSFAPPQRLPDGTLDGK
jgi:hypothetical protein